jgi:hypothetical protein
MRRFKGLFLVLLTTLTVAVSAAPTSAHDRGVVKLAFDKSAVAPGIWQGTVSGGVSGDLETRLLAIHMEGPVAYVTFDWIISAGAKSFTARLGGTLDTETGAVAMRGKVIEGWRLGARVNERGQLVDPALGRFVGAIKVNPAKRG